MAKTSKVFKRIYLALRWVKFSAYSGFTYSMRRKTFDKNSVKSVFVFPLKRLGDAVLSIPAFRAIKESLPQSRITVFAPSYVTDILERIPSIDSIIPYSSDSSFFQKARRVRKLFDNPFDLAVDLTCDYTIEGAVLSFLSGAGYRVGYDTWRRGFLFNRPVKHDTGPVHVIDEILNIVKSIGLDTDDKSLKISASGEAIETARKFLRFKDVKDKDLTIGIHPGGYYPTQRWLSERFAEVADKLIEKHAAHVVLMGGPKEEELIHRIKTRMTSRPIVFLNQPIGELLALIQSCHLLICNNSGPLHMATAVGTPTVSTMGPTLPERWWPQGDEHIVLRKDLSCMPCNQGRCRLKTLDCMKLITVEDMLEAAEDQLSRIKKIYK